MSNKDYGEVFLQSTEQIVDSKLSMVKFDQTIICTITDDSNAFNGEYQVSDGSVTFTAYSENRNYIKNMQVYVLIPQGNWANRKQITSLYSKNEDIIVRKRKKDELVIIDRNEQKNDGTKGKDESWLFSFQESNKPKKYNTELVNTLYITFKIQTNLYYNQNFYIDVRAGTGNYYDIVFPPFKSSQMLGNSLYYYTPVEQEITYSLDNKIIPFIDYVEFTLYPENENYDINNYDIKITEVNVYLCHDISPYENNTALIFPIKDFRNEYNDSHQNETPKMKLIWVNKDKYGRYIGFDGEFNEEKGKGIETDNGIIINGYNQIDSTAGKNYYWIDWYYDTMYKRLQLEDQDTREGQEVTEDECFVDFLTDFTNTSVQAKIWKNGQSYDSNIFTFKNTTPGELIIDSLLRLGGGEAFDINSDPHPQAEYVWIGEEVFNAYYFYPTFQNGAIGDPGPIQFAPGQQIKILNRIGSYDNPEVSYLTTIHDDEADPPDRDEWEDPFDLLNNSNCKIELVNNQTLKITILKAPTQGWNTVKQIKISNVSSLCLTSTKKNLQGGIELLSEKQLSARLAAAEARIQQLERQLSAYI